MSDQPKIKLWRMEEMLKNLSTPIIAVIFIKLEMSYQAFDPKKKYDNKAEVVLFNKDAFFNAFKEVTGKESTKLKDCIEKLKLSFKTDKKEFNKYHDKFSKIIDDRSKNYDKFDLSFDDVLFAPAFFEDERLKKILEDKKNKPKIIN